MSLIRCLVLICALATLQLVAGQQQQQQKILRVTKCDKMVVTSPANEESAEVKELCEKCCKNEGADLLSTISEPWESSDPDKPRFCRCFVWGAAPAPAPAAPQQPPAAYPYPAPHPYGQQPPPPHPYGPPPPHAYGPPPPAWGQHPYGYPAQGAYPPHGAYPPPAYPPYGYQPNYGPPAPVQYVQQGNNGGGLVGEIAATAGGVVLGELAANWIEDEFFGDE